jgi:hypothetical protein
VSWSPSLFSGSGPVRLPPVSWTEKQLLGHDFLSGVSFYWDCAASAIEASWKHVTCSLTYITAKLHLLLRRLYVQLSLLCTWSGHLLRHSSVSSEVRTAHSAQCNDIHTLLHLPDTLYTTLQCLRRASLPSKHRATFSWTETSFVVLVQNYTGGGHYFFNGELCAP